MLHVQIPDFDAALDTADFGGVGVDKNAMEFFVFAGFWLRARVQSRCDRKCSIEFFGQT